MKIIFILTTLLIASCASQNKAALPGVLESNEGFYAMNKIPDKFAPYISPNIIKNIKLSTGVSFAPKASEVLAKKDYLSAYQNSCLSGFKKWNKKLCQRLDTCKKQNSSSCSIGKHKKLICSGALLELSGEQFFVTSYHCSKHPRIKKDMYVRFLKDHDSKETIDKRITPLQKDHSLYPFGLFVYKIHNWPRTRSLGQIFKGELLKNEPVIHAGFPHPKPARTVFTQTYSTHPDGLRVSFGKIIAPNNKAYSFCLFTVNLGLTNHESWKFEKTCPTREELIKNKKYTSVLNTPFSFSFPREERDPFLANTDMINGMSGGPLFNQNGHIIGIGSTILKNSPPLNYNSKYPASFSKAKYFESMVK